MAYSEQWEFGEANGGDLRTLAPKFTIGTEAEATRIIDIRLYGSDGKPWGVRNVDFYLSDVATGAAITATPATTLASGTDGSFYSVVAGTAGRLVSKVNGHVDLSIKSVAHTYYLCICDGTHVHVSPAIVIAAA
jgi:hypothetical protein